MKLLLDENLPKRLKQDFPDCEVYTVKEKNWNGIQNGALLKLMIEDGFDAFLTFDKNLQHQQNFTKYTITVFVLTATINTYAELTKLSPKVQAFITAEILQTGTIIIQPD